MSQVHKQDASFSSAIFSNKQDASFSSAIFGNKQDASFSSAIFGNIHVEFKRKIKARAIDYSLFIPVL